MTGPVARPGIMNIPLYVAGESKIEGAERTAKLSSNESALGPSPKALAAYKEAAAQLERYPEEDSYSLRKAIGDKYGFDPARILCSAGSSQLLVMAATAYSGEGDENVFGEYGFLVYRRASFQAGATPLAVPETDYTVNVDNILDAVSEKTKIVFVANPANPTGTYLPKSEIERLHDNLPDHVLLVLDAAYADYVEADDYDPGHYLVDHPNQNVVVCHTFSKIHGLASLRVGWAHAPAEIAGALNRNRNPFSVSSAGVAAGVAALDDVSFVEEVKAHNTKWLERMTAEIRRMGFEVIPSVTNFILIKFKDKEQCSAANDYLRSRGVILRPLMPYNLPDCLRATIGLDWENELCLEALGDFAGTQ